MIFNKQKFIFYFKLFIEKVKQFFVYNSLAKLFALLLAIYLSYFLRSHTLIEKSLNVYFSAEQIPHNLMLAKELPERVNIIIAGNKREINNIGNDNIYTYINLSNSHIGQNYFRIQLKTELPDDIEIKRIEPSTISVQLDVKTNKILIINPNIATKPPDGYFIKDYKISPGEITVEGPQIILNDIQSINTEPIFLRGIKNNYEINVKLNNNNKLLFVPQKRIYIKFYIESEYTEHTFYNIPIQHINLQEKYRVVNEEDLIIFKVQLKIPRMLFENISEDAMQFYIDLSKIDNSGNFYIKVNHYLPEDFKIIFLDPQMVKVIIK